MPYASAGTMYLISQSDIHDKFVVHSIFLEQLQAGRLHVPRASWNINLFSFFEHCPQADVEWCIINHKSTRSSARIRREWNCIPLYPGRGKLIYATLTCKVLDNAVNQPIPLWVRNVGPLIICFFVCFLNNCGWINVFFPIKLFNAQCKKKITWK